MEKKAMLELIDTTDEYIISDTDDELDKLMHILAKEFNMKENRDYDSDELMYTIAKKLNTRVNRKFHSYSSVASELNISESTLRKITNGHKPSLMLFSQLCLGLGFDVYLTCPFYASPSPNPLDLVFSSNPFYDSLQEVNYDEIARYLFMDIDEYFYSLDSFQNELSNSDNMETREKNLLLLTEKYGAETTDLYSYLIYSAGDMLFHLLHSLKDLSLDSKINIKSLRRHFMFEKIPSLETFIKVARELHIRIHIVNHDWKMTI